MLAINIICRWPELFPVVKRESSYESSNRNLFEKIIILSQQSISKCWFYVRVSILITVTAGQRMFIHPEACVSKDSYKELFRGCLKQRLGLFTPLTHCCFRVVRISCSQTCELFPAGSPHEQFAFSPNIW